MYIVGTESSTHCEQLLPSGVISYTHVLTPTLLLDLQSEYSLSKALCSLVCSVNSSCLNLPTLSPACLNSETRFLPFVQQLQSQCCKLAKPEDSLLCFSSLRGFCPLLPGQCLQNTVSYILSYHLSFVSG